VIQLRSTKVSIYHAQFSPEYLKQVQSSEKVTETVSIHRYPKQGLDLDYPVQRKDLYETIFKILKYTIAKQDTTSPLTPAVRPPDNINF